MFTNDQRGSTTRVSHIFRGLRRKALVATGLMACLAVGVGRASAQFELETLSDGTDGVFNPAASVEVDLSQALTGPWDTPIPAESLGKGIYDSTQWAVVFKYSEINIPTGVTVTFKNHPSGAPVIWLVQQGATANITGIVSLNGASGGAGLYSYAGAGPGGFPGGVHYSTSGYASAGFGPGAGRIGQAHPWYVGGAGHLYIGQGPTDALRGPTYGEAHLLPLIGGSGGAGSLFSSSLGGGGGGGAILLAASRIVIDGRIEANGGSGGTLTGTQGGGGGSGGAVRLVADTVLGSGRIHAKAGLAGWGSGLEGGGGWLRIEAPDRQFTNNSGNSLDPSWYSAEAWGPIFLPTTAPGLRIVSIDGQSVASDPIMGLSSVEAYMGNGGQVPVVIHATNIKPGKQVRLLVNPARGQVAEYLSILPHLEGTLEASTVTIMVPVMPAGRVELQARATGTNP